MDPVIALLTDFGTRDHYVACMKGVILQINPKAGIVDVTHEINPQDIYHGAFVLRQTLPWFPPKTIFVAIVDPAVGTARRALAAKYSDRIVLAPDNGILTLLHRDAELQGIRVVENHQYFSGAVSRTFHGRDVFAPVAAHLSRGVPVEHLGPVADHMEVLSLAKPVHLPDGGMEGRILFADRFGNLITNISVADLSTTSARRHHFEVTIDSRVIGPIHTTYADVPAGQPVAIVGSTQMLEIAVNRGNAAEALGVSRGAAIFLRPHEHTAPHVMQ